MGKPVCSAKIQAKSSISPWRRLEKIICCHFHMVCFLSKKLIWAPEDTNSAKSVRSR